MITSDPKRQIETNNQDHITKHEYTMRVMGIMSGINMIRHCTRYQIHSLQAVDKRQHSIAHGIVAQKNNPNISTFLKGIHTSRKQITSWTAVYINGKVLIVI